MVRKVLKSLLVLIWLVRLNAAPAPAAQPADPLNRLNPRSTVTAFLESCHHRDYQKAAGYLDLSQIPASRRAREGPELAKDLESLLNSAAQFDVLRLSQSPEGNPTDDPNPAIEHVTNINSNDQQFTIELERKQAGQGPSIWLFSADTVAKIPAMMPVLTTESRIEAHLPRFLVTIHILETALWKWVVLVIVALVLAGIWRMLVRLTNRFLRWVSPRVRRIGSVEWAPAIVDPILILVTVAWFRIIEEIIAPAALARLYIGRTLLLIVVASVAWGAINLFDYVIVRIDRTLNQRQRVVSQSVMYLGRRTLKTVIAIFAAILILDNWGFDMTTILAGLGVGGIAVALAAQQTIANVFGGVSVIGDAPVTLGDFGNFGGVSGTVEDIGLRSTRIRTLSRTVVSIPNSSFAGMNLENYTQRDKILFNPTIAVKRGTPKDKIRELMRRLEQELRGIQYVEVGRTPVRMTGYSAASFTIEIFAYILTSATDEYHKHQAELFLSIDDVITASGAELV
ncbi:MAG: mechanosensitive ion channel family protein [Acidobacteriaceae bacterium]|nr:mechanosensitive ion channel family protein [Acidobacteriaceae bacterium]